MSSHSCYTVRVYPQHYNTMRWHGKLWDQDKPLYDSLANGNGVTCYEAKKDLVPSAHKTLSLKTYKTTDIDQTSHFQQPLDRRIGLQQENNLEQEEKYNRNLRSRPRFPEL